VLERQRERADQRVREIAAPRLQPGETIGTVFTALTRVRWLLMALPLFPILYWMESSGAGDSTPWVTGAWFGTVYLVLVRFHYVVATDRRVLVLRLRRLSSKHVTEDWEASGPPYYREGFLSGFLTLRVGERPLTLQVPATFRDRARALAAKEPEPTR
jgi:hypothetical protein